MSGTPDLLKRQEEVRRIVTNIQRGVERAAVSEFSRLADELGLRVTDIYSNVDPNSEDPTPPEALAQHHRVPTRLLDWTHSPYVAAYFAAEESGADQLAVWALHTRCLGRLLGSYQAPRSSHQFQHAQHGLFVWVNDGLQEGYLSRQGRWPTIDEAILHRGRREVGPSLRKVMLPRSEVQELRRLLWRERITRAHLMPTYDNVRDTLLGYWQAGW
jgi:hypothetical protein